MTCYRSTQAQLRNIKQPTPRAMTDYVFQPVITLSIKVFDGRCGT